jgi:hypothetical protein
MQNMGDYGEEDDDDEEKLSPQEIIDIINSYDSFKYEETADGETNNCAICID